MRKLTIALTTATVYAVLATLVLCTMVAETIFLYPNYFHDVPASLAVADEFTAVVSVGSVMRPLGMVLTLSAVLAVAAGVWSGRARGWLLASIVPFVSGMFLLSMLYLWPRWPILFEDRALYTVNELRRTVGEIGVAHAARVLCGLLTAVFAVIAALRIYRDRILLRAAQADYSSSPSVSR
ncbi:hypothetical protein [Nocardia caishijiensis]|uniref:DUF1772 domain-containing protein n=1 Tax=Nocardia caishijiensis TaxID=184756 RepID=A0ABQ6YN82_9NOCA|nr:hypothetical protein [Nocardia caishijiensis]KAF0847128.1 hypothetical protein FNL39_10325 [Nocardia caishijiensis]